MYSSKQLSPLLAANRQGLAGCSVTTSLPSRGTATLTRALSTL